jgi:hypothetical protein
MSVIFQSMDILPTDDDILPTDDAKPESDERIHTVQYRDLEDAILATRRMRGHIRARVLENLPPDTFKLKVHVPEKDPRYYYRITRRTSNDRHIQRIIADIQKRDPHHSTRGRACSIARNVLTHGFENSIPKDAFFDEGNGSFFFLNAQGKLVHVNAITCM